MISQQERYLSGKFCYPCAVLHFTGCLSHFAGPSLQGRSALLLSASSCAIKGRRELWIRSLW